MSEAMNSPLGQVGPELLIARYRHWYEQECDANAEMLAMLESVSGPARSDVRFGRAVGLAAHLAACRENYLEILQGRDAVSPWWPEGVALDSLRPRFASVEDGWSVYLNSLSDATLTQDFIQYGGDARYRWNVEGQTFQLLGHACYHRGQISLLVEELGGATVDTDYVDWALERDPRYGEIKD